jgi:protein FLOWERING LOCUS T
MELYHNNKTLPKNQWFDSDDIINLQIIWNHKNNIYYTLMIYDIDSPSLYVHLLVTNIPRNDIEYGNIILNYEKPNPPSGNHRYIIAVFEQKGLINDSKYNTRSRFPLLNFIKQNNLHLVDEKIIIVDHLHNDFDLADRDSLVSDNIINSKNDDPPIDKYNRSKNEDPPTNHRSKNNIMKQNSEFNERDEKYCSCVVKVAEKNTEICNLEENWGKTISGKTCYSPYAVCAKSVGTTSRTCDYDYEAMTKEQLISFLNLKKIKVDRKLNKNQLLEIIQNKKL